MNSEVDYDVLLHIETIGKQKKDNSVIYYNKYEPTVYSALKDLCDEFDFQGIRRVVDYGSGKGRFAFFINYFKNISVVGIEMNPIFHDIAKKNHSAYLSNTSSSAPIEFINCLAEDYDVQSIDDCFYFFNPFTVNIFAKVLEKILISLKSHNRKIFIILYQATPEYIQVINKFTCFEMLMHIDDHGVYPNTDFYIYQGSNYLVSQRKTDETKRPHVLPMS